MALEFTEEYISAQELTGYVREALADEDVNQFQLNQFLPDTVSDDIDFRADVGAAGLARVAQFRSFDTESPISGREGLTRISGELPPISEKRRLGEYDRLTLRKKPEAIKNATLNDGVELARAIKARLEVARGELLTTGKVQIAENGLALEADFGRKASHTVVVNDIWTDAASDPIKDLLAAQKTYVATNKVKPAFMRVSDEIEAALMFNDTIRAMVHVPGSTTQITTIDAINALLRSFRLPALWNYDAAVTGDSGDFDIIPSNQVLFLPPEGRKIGETLWGITAESLSPKYQIDEEEAPGIVLGQFSDDDPVALWTKASAVTLPVAPGIDYTMSIKVL